MANAAKKIEPTEALQETGTVTLAEGGRLCVETGSGVYTARRAVSCLVEPEVGDTVLTAVTKAGAAYVLAVLDRSEGAVTTIAADGDLEIRLVNGHFTVAAQDGVNLVSGGDVSVVSAGLDVNAPRASLVMEKLSFLGSVVQAEVDRLKLFAGSVDSVMTRLSQRVKRSYRVVEELDQVKAEQIDYSAKETARVHAKNAVITADGLVKVDGDQIHLG